MSKKWKVCLVMVVGLLAVLTVLAALVMIARAAAFSQVQSATAEARQSERDSPAKESAQPEQAPEPLSEEEERFKALRLDMVAEQIAKDEIGRRPVKDRRVLAAMRKVPRHEFVLPRYLGAAYADTPLPIGLGQTISQPYIVAFMTELLKPKPEHKVLEIGTGSGYQAAVLAELVKEVYTIEIYKQLGDRAKKRLEDLKYKKIKCKVADGYFGWQEHAPFDAIIVTCAADHIPPPLIKQLKPGGRMCIPVGNVALTQQLFLVEKNEDGSVRSKSVLPVRFVPLIRKAE